MLNQDKYKTPDERNHAFKEWCSNRDCESCELKPRKNCSFYWLALEAEEEKPEPCFYCGNKYLAITKDENNRWSVSCTACLYESRHHENRDTAITAHNRVCRAVEAVKKGDVK